jgi:predicted PurR-regulated permease PerM
VTDDEAQKLSIAEPYLPYSQSLALGLATLWFIYLCGEIVRPFFTVLAWSLALAVASYPLSSWLQERIFNRSLASFLALIAATLVIFAPTLWIVRILMTTAAENVVGLLQQSGVKFWLDPSTAPPRLVPLLTWLEQSLHLQQVVTDFVSSAAHRLPELVTMSLVGLVQVLLVLFTTFFFIRDANLFLAYLKWGLPLPELQTEKAVFRVLDTVHASLFGVVLMAILQGALGSAIFWWLNLPQPALWGVIMGLLAIVPYLGAFVIWTPTAFVLAMHGRWTDAIILVVWGSLVIGLVDNFLYPVLVGKRLHYHTLFIFLFLLGGVFVFGSAGIIIGPMILSVTHGLIALWQHEEPTYTPLHHTSDERPTVMQ